MTEHWSWTPDETGLDDADFPPFVLGDDDTPCAFCGEPGCEGTCTGAILARDASREDTP